MILKLCNDGKSVVGINDDGNMVSYLISAKEYIEWLAKGNIPDPEFTEEELKEKAIEKHKVEVNTILSKLTVTTSKENVFDATNQARHDMADSILASNSLKELVDNGTLPADTVWDKTIWRLADNSEVQIDISELKEAQALAIKEYARIKGIGI